jgi:hypothetical protein
MGLRLKSYFSGVPGGFKYFQKETNHTVEATTWNDLLLAVKKHRQSNGLAIGLLFEQEIEEQLCARMPPEICRHRDYKKVDGVLPLSWKQVLNGTLTISHWLVTGRELVEQTEANARARICGDCYFNRQTSGCAGCSSGKLRGAVEALVGKRKTNYDQYLRACGICGCSLKAKVWFPLDILHAHLSTEQNEQFPDFCWVKKKDAP